MAYNVSVLSISLMDGSTKQNATLKELRRVYYSMSLMVNPDIGYLYLDEP